MFALSFVVRNVRARNVVIVANVRGCGCGRLAGVAREQRRRRVHACMVVVRGCGRKDEMVSRARRVAIGIIRPALSGVGAFREGNRRGPLQLCRSDVLVERAFRHVLLLTFFPPRSQDDADPLEQLRP